MEDFKNFCNLVFNLISTIRKNDGKCRCYSEGSDDPKNSLHENIGHNELLTNAGKTPGILFYMYAKNEFKYIRIQYERKEKIHGL